MKLVVPRIIGGLGNQLFIYAAARRLAIMSGAELALDDVSGFASDFAYKRHFQLNHFNIPCRKATSVERLEPLSRWRRYLKRAVNRHRPFERRNYIRQECVGFDPRLLSIKSRGTVYLEGYWQSENYFKDAESVIRQELRIIPPNDEVNQEMAVRIRDCRAVALHVRYFDAPQERGVNNAPGEYYERAIEKMETLEPAVHYFVFSDQPDVARTLVPLPAGRITLVSHNQGDENAYADLWLMSQCQHFIIANSTFSWWGAWLARNPGKRVIAPGFEVSGGKMSWGFDGLLPDDWIKI